MVVMIRQYGRTIDVNDTNFYKNFYIKKSMLAFYNELIKSLNFIHLPKKHLVTLDELEIVVQRVRDAIY